MYIMTLSIITIMMMLLIIFTLIMFISKKSSFNKEKSTPFECGFNPMSYSRLPFSIHFFLIAVIFLIFDIEIILIMPMILTIKTSMMLFWKINSTMFILILLMGMYHEWKNGMIKWTK